MTKRSGACATTSARAMRKSADARPPSSRSTWPYMSDLHDSIERYLESLKRENASAHTLRNYRSDLKQLAKFLGEGT
ncbi:MAG: site-specific integrase, partial [Bryobacteraceae bacterium]|nr:site-specific integrase [Bryobacteraceae bacterium]